MGTDDRQVTAEKLLEGFVGILWNRILAEYGETRSTISSVEGSGIADPTPHIVRAFEDSIRLNQIVFAPPQVTTLHVLDAFDAYTAPAATEFAVVACTETIDSEIVVQLIAARGGAHHVHVPAHAYQLIAGRLRHGDSFTTVFVHNHPRNFLHDLVQLAELGPSSADRRALLAEYVRALGAGRRVRPEFYVFEGGNLIRFKFPAWQDIVTTLRAAWNLYRGIG